MYILLLLIGLGSAAYLVFSGGRRARIVAYCVAASTVAFFAMLTIWADALWFDSVGYNERFWRMLAIRGGALAVGALAVSAGVRGLLGGKRVRPVQIRRWPECLGALPGAVWGWNAWDELILFAARVPTSLTDPILGLSTGFYLFVLPLLGQLLWLAAITLAVAGASTLAAAASDVERGSPQRDRISHVLVRISGGLAIFLTAASALAICYLLYSSWGVVHGPGWTDVNVRLPALRVIGLLLLALGIASWIPALRNRLPLPDFVRRGQIPDTWGRLGFAWVGVGAAAFLTLSFLPAAIQWVVVQPNEISFERAYLANNIEFTRNAFRLHKAEVRQFPASETLSAETVANNRDLLDEARLWDQGALDAVYKQFQEIRLYYEFHDVDMDRYQIGDRYRQVMVSARELAHQNLPEQSQTFVNQRFKYTHGYGVTIAAVHDFTADGLPDLLVKDLPPQSTSPELAVDRPEIYYGELTLQPAVVRTLESEFDFPRGDQNVYTQYEGSGGVPLENLWRKFVFGWKTDGTLFFLSNYPREEARVMLNRQIRERARVLAPFLRFDSDPYVVVSNGRLFWILDAYTTSDHFPYSEPFESREEIVYRDGERSYRLVSKAAPVLGGENYVRNSVKVVIDAYAGDIDFYVFDSEDPIVKVWSRAFPDLFKPGASMPSELRAHVRYPEAFLLAQGLMYSKYHMTDPEVFYNQEDLWVRATEKYHSELQAVRPYYVMWKPPGAQGPEFGLILPFTPKNRQVMIGWIAGLCDGENYGRFIAYQFPKERRVLGPQQVETKIDQDRHLASQLTLWDQHGSQVIRGNTLAIPIEDALLYLQPIYLQADTAAYPELRLVVAMHGDNMSYGNNFEDAMAGLFREEPGLPAVGTGPPSPAFDSDAARRARGAFERYLRHHGAGDFQSAAAALEELSRSLNELAGPEASDPLPGTPSSGLRDQ